MKKNRQKYDIGLDIGTTSVGYAVVNKNSEILRFNNKIMMGVRLFDEGQTAIDTRINRSSRRRLYRRRNRIILLRELLKKEINEIDPTFFERQDNSFILLDEKEDLPKKILFTDSDFSDTEYYDKFPTIYHLRKYLITSNKKEDIRFVYLAIHHILKYRGHFLNGLEDFKSSESLDKSLKLFFEKCENFYQIDITKKIQQEFQIILNSDNSKSEKEKQLKNLVSFNEKELKNGFEQSIKAILGGKADYNKIFMVEQEDKLSFKLSDDIEDKIDSVEEVAGDDFEHFTNISNLYSALVLDSLLSGNEYFSDAMINRYEKYGTDLSHFKNLFKNIQFFSQEEKREMLSNPDPKKKTFARYTSTGKYSNEEFISDIKKIFEKKAKEKPEIINNEDYKYCLESIAKNDFLIKLRTKANASLPHQVHKMELIKILDNQREFHRVIDENYDKIISILTFKIPYFVGPLNSNNKSDRNFAWAKKYTGKENEKIYPWNFNEIIDKDQAAEEFIKRMRNKCTYLPEEDVLPKNSLLYQEFILLNELNNIKITYEDKKDAESIPRETKVKIIEQLFKKQKTVTKKKMEDFFRLEGHPVENSTGYQKEERFASSLNAYIDFTKIVGKIDESNQEMIEEIIGWVTLFRDKEIIRKRIEDLYTGRLSVKQINQILNKEYSGWARFSQKFLDGIQSIDKEDGRIQPFTIIERMRSSNDNLMQIINNEKFQFKEKLEDKNKLDKKGKIYYDQIDELATSPANKKGIWQTVKVVEEIIKIMGYPPNKIYLEMARGKDKKPKRTTSRYKKIESLLKQSGDKNLLNEFSNISENQISDRLYFYFIQEGKCMYTGEPLDINNLISYDIDHIMPQSYIKDDSLSNRVLVKKIENLRKLDDLLISSEVQEKMMPHWARLFDKGMISKKKFALLTKTHLLDKDKERFINRQLVQTRQIIIHVKNLFESSYETNVECVKSGLISNYRHQNHLYKNRNLNNFHHAHDAYLACLVGQYIDIRFPKWKFVRNKHSKIIAEHARKQYNTSDPSDGYDYLIGSMNKNIAEEKTGEIIWQGKERLDQSRKVLQYKNILISKKKEENKGMFYNQTINPKGDSDKLIPLKKGLDPKKYGGYTGEQQAYYALIEFDGKKGRERKFVGIPVQRAYLIRDEKLTLMDYLSKEKEFQNVSIIKEKVMKYQLFEGKNADLFYMVSDSEFHSAKEIVLDEKFNEILFFMEKEKAKKYDEKITDENLFLLINHLLEKLQTHFDCYKSEYDRLKKSRDEGLIETLSLEEKKKFINQVIKIMHAGSSVENMTWIKGKSSAGRIFKTHAYKFKKEQDQIELIDRSVTGLFETRTEV